MYGNQNELQFQMQTFNSSNLADFRSLQNVNNVYTTLISTGTTTERNVNHIQNICHVNDSNSSNSVSVTNTVSPISSSIEYSDTDAENFAPIRKQRSKQAIRYIDDNKKRANTKFKRSKGLLKKLNDFNRLFFNICL